MSVAAFSQANEFGIIRREFVANTIDALRVETNAGQSSGCRRIVKSLRAPNSITNAKQRLLTQSLLDIETGNPLQIPVGASDVDVKVDKTNANVLDDNLHFMLGYLSNDVSSNVAKKALAGRVAGADNQISGSLLNSHRCVDFPQRLTAAELAAQQKLYADDAVAAGEPVPADVNAAAVSGAVYVGESKALFPAITVTDGLLDCNDLVFTVSFNAPAFQE